MEYVYSALLLHKAGKKVEEGSVRKVLEAAGVQADDARVKALVAALDGVNIDEAIKKAAVTAVAAPAAVAGAGADAGKAAEDEAKKAQEEKKSEEAAAAGLGALFG
ncbi:50S ribosomal protein P1 [Candidatus Woesearchaeota archaeon]|nr:50S ribosomal protein P1 [Candidatus Woesearchaeota archaeon]